MALTTYDQNNLLLATFKGIYRAEELRDEVSMLVFTNRTIWAGFDYTFDWNNTCTLKLLWIKAKSKAAAAERRLLILQAVSDVLSQARYWNDLLDKEKHVQARSERVQELEARHKLELRQNDPTNPLGLPDEEPSI